MLIPAARVTAVSLLMLLGLLMATYTAVAENPPDIQKYLTTGKQKIVKENIFRAKQKAVDMALETAVQNALTSLVPGQALASNLDIFYDRLLADFRNFIVTYKVLGEMVHGENYLVGVESKVDFNRLKRKLSDARVLNMQKDKPDILLLMAEQVPGDILPRYWWGNNPEPYFSTSEAVILEQMVKSGFEPIRETSSRPYPSEHGVTFPSIYDADAAMALGRELGADMVIIGQARAWESTNRMGDEKAFDATIELRAYDVKSGLQAVMSSIQAVAKSEMEQEGGRKAISRAADLAARDIVEKLDKFWGKSLKRENIFDLAIEGDPFLARFIDLKKKLRELPGIEALKPKEIASSKAVMEVAYKGSASKFVDALMLKSFDGFRIEITDVSDTLVAIRFIEKAEP